MSDEFDRLREVMRQATPDPDPKRKADDIALAMEIFDRVQESDAEARPMSDRPRFGARLGLGAAKMIHALSTRGALAASTAIVALGVTFYVTLPELRNTGFGIPESPIAASRDEIAASTVAPTPEGEGTVMADALETSAEPEIGSAVSQTAPKELSGLALEEAAPAGTGNVQFSADATVGVAPVTAPSIAERRVSPAAGGFTDPDMVMPTEPNTEAYANEAPNPVKVTAEEPVSTFSIDVDTASWGGYPFVSEPGANAADGRGADRGDGKLLPLCLPGAGG